MKNTCSPICKTGHDWPRTSLSDKNINNAICQRAFSKRRQVKKCEVDTHGKRTARSYNRGLGMGGIGQGAEPIGFAQISGTTSSKSGVDMSILVHPVATPLLSLVTPLNSLSEKLECNSSPCLIHSSSRRVNMVNTTKAEAIQYVVLLPWKKHSVRN